jgi:hypothetical protein
MRFEYQRIDSLPRLAWCARIARGASQVRVRHGPWIEARDDRFFEGAWEGDFAEGRFDEAAAFTGSGGIARGPDVTFVGSMNLHDWLYVVRADDELVVSNSLVFALVETDDAPDLSYPYYYGDILAIYRAGTTRPERAWLPTRRGRRVFLHAGVRLRITPELACERALRPEPAMPATYADYVRLLEDHVARVVANAADARRARRYRPLVAISRGYDSPAIAVLAARAGAREAFTFGDAKGTGVLDNGRAIAERLGYAVTEVPHLAYQELPGMAEAETCLCDWGYNAPFAGAEALLTGSLLLRGSHGDVVWRKSPVFADSRHPTATTTGGGSMIELRLRMGFAHMSVPYLIAQDPGLLRRMTLSEAMRPWSVGGDYDRPIPRRIAEEGGVPRDAFGHAKANAAHAPFRRMRHDTRESQRDLRRFVAAVPRDRARDWTHRMLRRASAVDAWGSSRVERALNRLGADVMLAPVLHPRWRKSKTPEFYAFHWGFERIRDRYVVS